MAIIFKNLSTLTILMESRTSTMDFVPRLQYLSAFIAFLNSSLMFLAGILFVFLPQTMLHHIFQRENPIDDSSSSVILGLAGSLLISQAIACVFLLYPIMSDSYSQLVVWNVRASVTIQIVTGLLWIIVTLFDDRFIVSLLMIGFVILLIGCLSMMLSFFPVTVDMGENDVIIGDQSRQLSRRENGADELTEPLLPMGDIDEDNSDNNLLSNDDNNEETIDDEFDFGENDEDDNPEPTSRIKGTYRLLAVAKPELKFLYIGCIALMIRLPFSLSIPHFISTTLGALSDGHYDRATREIVWLFILGTIDACLDFWCIFCKFIFYFDGDIHAYLYIVTALIFFFWEYHVC